MSTVKILSGIITAAVVTSACSMAVFAEGKIVSTSGVNGEITYSFSGITAKDNGNTITSDNEYSKVELHLASTSSYGYSDTDGMHLGASGNSYVQNKPGRDPETLGDYVIVKAHCDGTVYLTGQRIGYWKDGSYLPDGYFIGGSPGTLTIDLDAGQYIAIGFRDATDMSNTFITSIKFTPDEFTPDKYSEAYTFNLNADEIYGKSLVVDYTENDENKTTEPKLLSDLIETQISGEGNVLFTGLNFTDIPNTVTINTVTIE